MSRSLEGQLRATEAIVHVCLPVHRAVRHRYACQALLSRISPVTSYCHGLCELDDDVRREWALLATHDSLTDWYRQFWTGRQIGRTMDQLGLTEIDCVDRGYDFAARGCGPE